MRNKHLNLGALVFASALAVSACHEKASESNKAKEVQAEIKQKISEAGQGNSSESKEDQPDLWENIGSTEADNLSASLNDSEVKIAIKSYDSLPNYETKIDLEKLRLIFFKLLESDKYFTYNGDKVTIDQWLKSQPREKSVNHNLTTPENLKNWLLNHPDLSKEDVNVVSSDSVLQKRIAFIVKENEVSYLYDINVDLVHEVEDKLMPQIILRIRRLEKNIDSYAGDNRRNKISSALNDKKNPSILNIVDTGLDGKVNQFRDGVKSTEEEIKFVCEKGDCKLLTNSLIDGKEVDLAFARKRAEMQYQFFLDEIAKRLGI